jgi:hypothetical protein
MRNLKPLVAAILLSVSSVCAYSQDAAPVSEPNYNKPQLFSSLPDNIKVDISNLKSLLATSVGDAVTSSLSAEKSLTSANSFVFSGQVISTANKYDNKMQSVVIRSANFNGAGLIFSRFTNEEGVTSYSGRIISFEHGDAYELQLIDGDYQFVKKKFHQLVNE